jgi:hypothetical protein
VSEKEHPASVAGRFVRAAGAAISKEFERRAAESAERPAEAPAQSEAAPQAPQAAATAGNAAPKLPRGRAAPEPRPWFDRILWFVFLLSLIALALTGLQIQMLMTGSVRTGARVAMGIPLVIGAFLLLSNWARSNERIVARLLRRVWGVGEATTRSGRFMRKRVGDGMTLLGIVLLAAGVFQLLRALVDP